MCLDTISLNVFLFYILCLVSFSIKISFEKKITISFHNNEEEILPFQNMAVRRVQKVVLDEHSEQ